MEIWHLAHRDHWERAVEVGAYRVSTRGASLEQVGFIHASLPEQLQAVAEFIHADDPAELCVLILDADRIRDSGTEVKFEDGGTGEHYPHIYGAIDPSWVIDVLPAGFDAAGRFVVDQG